MHPNELLVCNIWKLHLPSQLGILENDTFVISCCRKDPRLMIGKGSGADNVYSLSLEISSLHSFNRLYDREAAFREPSPGHRKWLSFDSNNGRLFCDFSGEYFVSSACRFFSPWKNRCQRGHYNRKTGEYHYHNGGSSAGASTPRSYTPAVTTPPAKSNYSGTDTLVTASICKDFLQIQTEG